MTKQTPYSCHEQPVILQETWHSFYQQQQQAEAVADDQQQQQQQQKQEDPPPDDDPFKDIPLDNLDDATKAGIEKARLAIADRSKTQRELNDRYTRLEKTAAKYQSDAQRAQNILQRHNLTDNGNVNKPVKSAEEQQEEALVARYLQTGLNEAQAKAHARIFMDGMAIMKPALLGEVGGVLGPALGKLNGMAADRYLSEYGQTGESQVALKVPGVVEGARQILDTMIQNRQDITPVAVDTAIKLALGEAMMKSGGQLPKTTTPPNTTPSILATLFGGNIGGNGNVIPPTLNGSGQRNAPVPANEDTARAATLLAATMDREIKRN